MKKTLLTALIILAIASFSISGAIIFRSIQQKNQEIQTIETAPIITPLATPTSTILEKTGALETGIPLEITTPSNNAVVSNASLIVKGKTVAKAEVSVNDKDTIADSLGYFSVGLTLDEGENPVLVVANDADGNAAEKEFLVTYEIK